MRTFTTIGMAAALVLTVGIGASADSFVATLAPVQGLPLTAAQSDLNYEGDAEIDGFQHNVGNPDAQGWVQDIYDTNVTWSAAGGVATVRLTTPNNGSDGGVMRVAMKPADGSGGLSHTVDVRAARPDNAWVGLGGSGDNGRGAGFTISAPVNGSSRKFYHVFLGDAQVGGDPAITDKIIVEVLSGAKASPDRSVNEITVPGLDIGEFNNYRMAMNEVGDLRVYVNEYLAYALDGVLTFNDDGNKLDFGLVSPRSAAGDTNFQLDMDFVRIDTGSGIFEAPVPEPATLVLLGLGSMLALRRRRA